jgi:hypothetical protein
VVKREMCTCDCRPKLPSSRPLLQRLNANLLCLFPLHSLVDTLLQLMVEGFFVWSLLVIAGPSLLHQSSDLRISGHLSDLRCLRAS